MPVATMPEASSAPTLMASPPEAAAEAALPALRAASGAASTLERAAPKNLTRGNGMNALAASRNRTRARCTNWRTAPSESPIVRATCARGKPNTAVPSRASR